MQREINKWVDIVKEALSDLIYDYRKFGERSGYGHIREEDIRCFLFARLWTLWWHDKFLINLHANVPIVDRKTVDIALGLRLEEGPEEESGSLEWKLKGRETHKLQKSP